MKLRIKEVAKRKGFTMRKLAEISKIDNTTISRYNSGRVEPPLSRLQEIATVLNCEVVELIPVSENFGHFELNGEWEGIKQLSTNDMKSTLTYKDFKSQSVNGNEVEFLMKDGTTVYVNTEDNTVEIEDELIIDADYEYYLQAAIEVLAENEARESENGCTKIETEKRY